MASWPEAMPFAQVWTDAVVAHGDRTFLIFEGPGTEIAEWTYNEFDVIVGRVASSLFSLGVEPGSSVHVALSNSPSFVAIWIAAMRMGAWFVPSDPMSRTPELADHVTRTRPVVGVCGIGRADVYRAAAPASLPIIVIDEADADFASLPADEFHDWATPALTDRAAVMFTSGTTGRPKGVEITQANYAFAAKTMAAAADLTCDDRHIVVLPLFHANAQYYSFASAIWVGASVALMHTFSASGFLPQCARHSATCASLFAAPIRMILARGQATEGVALRHCWFAQNIATDQYAMISKWIGCAPRQLYGMTETIPAVLTDQPDRPRPDSMGYMTSGCEVELHNFAGARELGTEVGEVVVGGERGVTLFAGYLDDPETTAASFRDDWFLTGDEARRDNDGRFFFAGRRSDLLKVAGENVSTVEVEAVLSAHPNVLEAAVIGAPDEVRDEVPVAFVVARDGCGVLTVDELVSWCSDRLAKSKVPREITMLDELPRTSVGKVRKFILKEKV
jgi:carnitine-CoA ligase